MIPEGMCGEREAAWDDPWMAFSGDGFAATCVLRPLGIECRAQAVLLDRGQADIDCDEGWRTARVIPAPSGAQALVADWRSYPKMAVFPVEDPSSRLPSMLTVQNQASSQAGRRQTAASARGATHPTAGAQRLSMRTDGEWRTTASPLPQGDRGFDVKVAESFDASALTGDGSWAVTSVWSTGCGQCGRDHWSLTVLRASGAVMVTVAERALGDVGWSLQVCRAGDPDCPHSYGGRLVASPGAAGTVLLTLTPLGDEAGESNSLGSGRDDAGVWRLADHEFVRAEP